MNKKLIFSGFAKLFKGDSDEERDHGIRLINYMAERGGTVQLKECSHLEKKTWNYLEVTFQVGMGLLWYI